MVRDFLGILRETSGEKISSFLFLKSIFYIVRWLNIHQHLQNKAQLYSVAFRSIPIFVSKTAVQRPLPICGLTS